MAVWPTSTPRRTRSTTSSRRGDTNALISTSSRCRCCRGWTGWPACSGSGGPRSSLGTICAATNSTCWPRCAAPGEPFELTAGELAARTYVTSGTMTSRLDGLTDRGLVTRAADRDDGRLVLVALTPAGRALVDAAFEALLAAERELLTPLPAESLAPLAALLRSLLVRAVGP